MPEVIKNMGVGGIIEVDIVGSGMNGEGVARVDGKVVFVPYTLSGERVRAVIQSVKKKYATAQAIKILEPSPFRVRPKCPHYYKCGGCDTEHLDGAYRRELLLGELKNNLKKIAGIEFSPSFVECSRPARNKTAMPFGLNGGKIVLGMYRQNSHTVEPVSCMHMNDAARKIADAVCRFANEKRLGVYEEKSGKGLLRHLAMRTVGERTAATLVINAKEFDGEKELAAGLPESCDFFISENTKKNNVIMGESVRLIKGNARLNVDVLGVKAELSPLSFFQVNDEIRDMLYTDALNFVTGDTFVDLYSGIGITSNLAAKKCKNVYAVECVEAAVKDADRTAAINGNTDKIQNICGDAESVLPRIMDKVAGADVLVDPPRKGCGAAVMTAIACIKPNALIYISCNHATMCRDIKIFTDLSPEYELTSCTAYDMFCGTHHVETIVCLKRKTRQ